MSQHESEFHSLLGLGNVPLYAYTIFCLSTIHWWMLGWFHILSTANNTALSIGMQISVWVPAFSSFGVYTQKWNCCIMWQFYFLIFFRNHYIFSIAAIPLYIFTNNSISLYLGQHLLLSVLFIYLFDNNHPNGHEVESHYVISLC